MELNAQELYEYIKEHGTTKCVTTDAVYEIPKDTILYFDKSPYPGYISTFDCDTEEMNKQFEYSFDYHWHMSWHDTYKGKFILLTDDTEEESRIEEFDPNKTGSFNLTIDYIDPRFKDCWKAGTDNSKITILSTPKSKPSMFSYFKTYNEKGGDGMEQCDDCGCFEVTPTVDSLENFSKKNLAEAKAKIEEEKATYEVEEAKKVYRDLIDRKERLDRNIREANKELKEVKKDLKTFEAK